jgi:hypothetical protein
VKIAESLLDLLPRHGHTTFIDRQIPIGQEWPAAIESELTNADFLIVLLSEKSAASEMVFHEVSIAHRLKTQRGRPAILPVRVAYKESFPYDPGAKLERIQYRLWEQDGDETRIGADIVTAMNARQMPGPAAVPQTASPDSLGADGNAMRGKDTLAAPLPVLTIRVPSGNSSTPLSKTRN